MNSDYARSLSVIIPASNEARLIGAALASLLSSRLPNDRPGSWFPVQIVVVANGCKDDTANVARSFTDAAAARGWTLTCLDIEKGGKLNALNVGDDHAVFANRAYLDADVLVEPELLFSLAEVLASDEPVYASGMLRVSEAQSFVTRCYAKFWTKLPFASRGVPGCGLFAVNAAGRTRWGRFPNIIADDMFVRLQFAPAERRLACAYYDWPMVEGFRNLVTVRRRQDRGVREVSQRYPELLRNEDKVRLGAADIARIALSDPVGFVVYSCVSAVVRMRRIGTSSWERGR
jgi:glycosyltransferase involved in cell wall biosynthesis